MGGARRRGIGARRGAGAGIAIGVALGVLGAATADPGAAQAPPGQFRGDLRHAGVVETSGVERLGGILWEFETEGPVRGSPTVVEGVVYVGSRDGRLYALDAVSGRPRWVHDAGAPVGGAPLVTADRVVFTTRGNTVHALSRADGRALWTVRTGPDLPLEWGHEGWDYILPSPALEGATVLVGSGDGHLRALALADGRERWRFRTGGRIRSTPAVADGVAYFGSGDGFVYGVDVRDGREVWRFRTAGVDLSAEDWGFDRTQIQGSAALAGGTLYIGSRDASLYAVDLASREALWTFEDGSAWVVGSPAVHGRRVYNGRSSSGNVRALDAATGEEIWVRPTGGLVFSSPVVVGETLYVGSGDGAVYALATADGSVRWRYVTGGMVIGTPAVHDGVLYVGSDDGSVYALRAAVGPAPLRAVYWDDAMQAVSLFGRTDDHRRLASSFEEHGYEPLDTAGVRAFLEDRVADRVPSVVVFGMDGVPASVIDPDDPGASLLRRYLDAGGKVVWPGRPPLVYVRDDEGRITAIDRARPARLLDVDFHGWDTDVYGVRPTPAGERWGLESRSRASPGVAADAASTVLALDETGRAAAWVRSYGGPEGSGWVAVPPTLDPARLSEMRRVAEYGIFRAPPPPGP